MRKYITIDLGSKTTASRELSGREIAESGRYLIARMLLDQNIATIDPMSPENPLIFSAGPFAGTNFSNANRLSVGCKSPLTGGIKEANSGGTFGFAMGQLLISGITLQGARTLKGNPRNQQLAHRKTECAAAIRLFNAASQRAFTANA